MIRIRTMGRPDRYVGEYVSNYGATCTSAWGGNLSAATITSIQPFVNSVYEAHTASECGGCGAFGRAMNCEYCGRPR